LELGVLGMCLGEQRRLTVPPALGFGHKGSVPFGVPPDATLEYRVKLVSVNGQTDTSTKRADLPDEKRY
jgi:FKBP-type peptidyl-prolyl cis-trans isomerase